MFFDHNVHEPCREKEFYMLDSMGEVVMKDKKIYKISILIISCICINYVGKVLAANLGLPLWLDSFGTVVTAYTYGPVCGAVVGATVNILYGIYNPMSYLYAVTNIAVGITVGICAKKRGFESLFRTMSVSVLVTLVSVAISTPCNYFFYKGRTGNTWGDGVISFLGEAGFPRVLCVIMGEFYLDFVDKVVTLLLLYAVIRTVHRFRNRKKAEGVLMMAFLLVMAYAFCSAPPVHAKVDSGSGTDEVDYNSYIQTVYNGDNGLPGGGANAVVSTKDGLLWIGTYGGLYRYNGSEFKWMDEFETVKNVNCLYTDEEGRLWIGTNDTGLSICINEEIYNVVDEEDGLPADSVRCITESADGYYYVGTVDGVAVLTLYGGLSVHDTISEITFTTSIDADDNGNVAVVTDEGELFLLREMEILTQESLGENGENFHCCSFDQEGRLYVGTSSNHILVYDISSGSLKKRKEIECGALSNIQSLTFSDEGRMFICSDTGVGYLDEAGQYRDINTNNFNNSIDCMTIDYQGNLWFTSSRLGLLRLCGSPFMELYSKAGLAQNVVNATVEWNGTLYFGTDNGLDALDAEGNAVQEDTLVEAMQNVRIRCLKVDSKNHLWICTSGRGLLEVKTNGKMTTYDSENGALGDRFRTCVELCDGTIAAAGDLGLTFIKNGSVTGTVGHESGLHNPKVLSLEERQDGTLLAGTDGGGIAILSDGKVTGNIGRSDGLSSDVILRMVENLDQSGVFIVTSNGLCYMEDDTVRVLKNFPYYNNYDVVENTHGNLYVLGSAGIYVVDKETLLGGEEVAYELLNSKKGLRGSLTANSWNYIDESGNLYLSCDNGVSVVNIENDDTTVRSYRMMVKSVKVDGVTQDIDNNETVKIERGASSIEIVPEVLNYSINDPYVSVYLEGYQDTPTVMLQSELTSVVYENLPTGMYTFHLSVLDNQKADVIEEIEYRIEKEKEIYDNWWFRLYLIFVLALVIAWLTWFVTRMHIQRTLDFQRKELEFVKRQVKMGNETIIAIAKAVDARDENTSQHSVRVSEYSVLIARKLGFTEEKCEDLRRMALLHDIGKIGIPDSVLNKPSRLTDEEYEIMKTHVIKGAEILKDFSLVEHIADGALYHHERYDGRGYAHGLKGEEIPLNARIIGIADAFDAMTANRVYRKKLDIDFVLGELRKGSGTQFDPALVEIMLGLIEEKAIDVEKLYKPEKEQAE